MRRVIHIGRNDRCWCGSEKKFKHCHYGREDDAITNPWEAEAKIKKQFERKICSAPAQLHKHCKGGIVKAHTIARTAGLSKIARDGHVYSFLPTSIGDIRQNNGILWPKLRGTKNASTFSGFCSLHDGVIFSPLEQSDFTGTPEQCFLLGYRAISREYYTKQSASDSMEMFKKLDSGKDLSRQIGIQRFLSSYEEGTEASLRNVKLHKATYDQVLLSRDFSTVRSYIIHIEQPPEIMCSSGLFPTVDFLGRQMQDLSNLDLFPHLICFSSFAFGNSGAIVFSWLAASDGHCIPFIRSLDSKSDADLLNCLVWFFFESSENLHLNPIWWEGLSADVKNSLVSRVTTMANLTVAQASNPYAGDGQKYVNWKIEKRVAMGFPLSSNTPTATPQCE